jgi:hypothetical protein
MLVGNNKISRYPKKRDRQHIEYSRSYPSGHVQHLVGQLRTRKASERYVAVHSGFTGLS